MSQGSDVPAEATTGVCPAVAAPATPAVPAAAEPAFPAVGPMPGEAASICEAVSRVFPDWRVWWHADIYYARRTGSYLEVPGAAGAYAVWQSSPIIFVLMLDAQDRARPAGRWDAPPRREPAAADLTKFGLVRERSPMDLARDVIAARIEAEHPGWVIDHVLTGWTAVWLDDPRYQLRTQSSAELTARLPPRGKPPRWLLG
jgi:hypothetical protein